MLEAYTKATLKSLKHKRHILNHHLPFTNKHRHGHWLQRQEKWDEILFHAHNTARCKLERPISNNIKPIKSAKDGMH